MKPRLLAWSYDSDIDVLVVRPSTVVEGDGTWQRQHDEFASTISVVTGNDCRLLELSEIELRELVDRGQRLADELRAHAIVTPQSNPVSLLAEV